MWSMTKGKSKLPNDPSSQSTREERLAAKLRENLRRRKAQAREQADPDAGKSDVSKPSHPG